MPGLRNKTFSPAVMATRKQRQITTHPDPPPTPAHTGTTRPVIPYLFSVISLICSAHRKKNYLFPPAEKISVLYLG